MRPARPEAGIVEAPAGRYRINGTSLFLQGVTLQGTYRVPPTDSKTQSPTARCCWPMRAGDPRGPPFIRLAGRNAAVAGLVVDYPEWSRPTCHPSPTRPAWSRRTRRTSASATAASSIPTRRSGWSALIGTRPQRHRLPQRRGIFVDECYDIGHIENIHFWPFGVAYNPTIPTVNGSTPRALPSSWPAPTGTTSSTRSASVTAWATSSPSRSPAAPTATSSAWGRFLPPRRAGRAGAAPGLLITNGEFVGRWGSTDSVCVEIGQKAEGKVSLVNCSFWGPIDRCVWMRSPRASSRPMRAISCTGTSRGAPAIQLDAGEAIVQGCTFTQDGKHVQVVLRWLGTADIQPGYGEFLSSELVPGGACRNICERSRSTGRRPGSMCARSNSR